MLYDPKWKQPKIKPKFLTLPHLIEWLKTKPEDERYKFSDIHHCLLTQYIKETRPMKWLPASIMTGRGYSIFPWKRGKLPEDFLDIAIGIGGDWQHTFGAALKRAELFNKAE
jgi:hypothetical protein